MVWEREILTIRGPVQRVRSARAAGGTRHGAGRPGLRASWRRPRHLRAAPAQPQGAENRAGAQEVAWNDHELVAFFDSMGFEPAARLVLETEISGE